MNWPERRNVELNVRSSYPLARQYALAFRV